MSWTAVIPFKGSAERKTRLRNSRSAEERQRFSLVLFAHVVGVLRRSPSVSNIILLSDVRQERWQGEFVADRGRGLNAELKALVESRPRSRLLIIHADLPLVSVDDVGVLTLDRGGCNIAPDRHGAGTNALALTEPAGFDFAFGPGSFDKHMTAARGAAWVVSRPGLGLDIDTEEDMEAAISLGFCAA